LHPEVQLLLFLRKQRVGTERAAGGTPQEARERMRRETLLDSRGGVAVPATREFFIPGPGGPLRVRHYVPDPALGPHPLLVYFHGGGFVLGDLDTHDAACRLLCREAGVHVLSVEYRLAPEHRFPAAIDDARAAFRWAREHAQSLGADPTRVGVGGDSAGGNLATVVTLIAARSGEPMPALQLLIYPSVDRSRPYRSVESFANGFLLTRDDMEWFYDLYVDASVSRANPDISPLRASPLPKLAPALILTVHFDPLRDEGDAYAKALRESGTRVVHIAAPGLVHGFLHMTSLIAPARDAMRELSATLRGMFATL
jgi:acetyl esterase